jgi:hypothetical protein
MDPHSPHALTTPRPFPPHHHHHAAAADVFDASSRFRVMEALAQEAQRASGGPFVAFPNPDPPDAPSTAINKWPES